MHLVQAQNVHVIVELAEHQSGVFNATFVPNRSYDATEWLESGRIRQLDVWVVCGGL